ncbi:MAG: bifunctional metallophosphatase/5'-nucleotidase, partial [Pyrinomonadaceae bacterium]
LDPVEIAKKNAWILRNEEHCDIVVCLSHLGYYPDSKQRRIGDTQVASQVDGIDFIASGHTHTFMEKPISVHSPSGYETIIFQVGHSGVYLGRIDFTVKKGQRIAITGRALDIAIFGAEAAE